MLVFALAILAGAGAIATWGLRAQREATDWVTHTYEVLERIQSLSSATASAETAQRAYLLTADRRQLEAMRAARRAGDAMLGELRSLTADNPRQQHRLGILGDVIGSRMALLDRVVALWDTGRRDDAVTAIRDRGIGEMSRLSGLLRDAADEERRLLDLRIQRASRASRMSAWAVSGASALTVLLLLGMHLLSGRHTARLVRGQAALERSRQETADKAGALAQANTQLRDAAATLEQRVDERTIALAEANADLEAFARTVAHDLRAPLRNIQGYATALAEDEADRLSAEGEDYTRRLIDSAQRLDQLITDLLDYSRLSRTSLRLERVDLDGVVRAALEQHASDIGDRGASVHVQTPLPDVQGHAATLQQVLSNLVGNALKFVQPGERPDLRIEARADGDRVVLTVRDRGIGIAPEHHERVFSVFERLHGQEAYPGTGIGLAVVRRGVERMGGDVTLHSAPGEGACFELHLPGAA